MFLHHKQATLKQSTCVFELWVIVSLASFFTSVVSLQVKATDADADQFGEIEYFLYDGFHYYEKSKAFQIDPRTGQICVSQDIDRENDPTTYDLLVKATDGVCFTFP